MNCALWKGVIICFECELFGFHLCAEVDLSERKRGHAKGA